MTREKTTISHPAGVVLTNVKFQCTDCKKWKPGMHFGLRKMRDGKIRNQPQCKRCRSKYSN